MKKYVIALSVFISATLILTALTISQTKQETAEKEKQFQEQKLKRIQESAKAERKYQEQLIKRQYEITQEMKKDYPGLYRTLEKLKEEQGEDYRKVYREFTEQYERMTQLRKENPELLYIQMKVHEVQIQLDMVAAKYKRVENKDARSKLKVEMKSLLNDLFDLKVKKRELEIISLDKEIDQLRNELQEIRKNKDESIKLKLQQLTQTDVFSW
jgi:hypothetical protein